MDVTAILLSALMQGVLYAPMALGIYISFRVLNTPDLTVDGSFVFGMAVCAVVTVSGHPVLAIPAGAAAGALAGLVTGLFQTSMGLNPILSGILTMTGLYTVNYAVLGGQSNLYLQSTAGGGAPVPSQTIYKLAGGGQAGDGLVLALTAVILAAAAAVLAVFFKTRPGMAVRATGDNEEMVRSSSINADASRILGIMLSNAMVGLSGGLLCQQQRYADLGCGSGMLVVGLASVIIGQALFGQRGVTVGLVSAAVGSVLYRIIIQAAYQINMPSYTVKLLSVLIVAAALSLPLLKRRFALERARRGKEEGNG